MGVKTHTWRGVKAGKAWQEYFGEPNGLPTRDLTEEDIDGFNAEQHDKLASDTGQRLYVPVKEKPTTTIAAPKPAPAVTKPRAVITQTGDNDGNE